MDDRPSLLPDEARLVIDHRLRSAAAARTVRSTRPSGGRRHRLAAQLRYVADRLDT